MAWTIPTTWLQDQQMTEDVLNQQVRDNMNFLSTQLRTADAQLMTCLAAFAYSAGQGNAAGGADTALTSYNVTVPAGYLSQPGDVIVFRHTWVTSADANTKTWKVKIGSAAAQTLIAVTTASLPVFSILAIRYRTASTASVVGAFVTGNSRPIYLTFTGLNWAADQVVTWYAAGTAANAVLLTDMSVDSEKCVAGVTV